MSLLEAPTFIVLSAGTPHYGNEPSSLKKTTDSTRILDWQLNAIEGLCNKKILVSGYHANEFDQEIFKNVQIINNKMWAETRSVYSFLLALEEVKNSALVTYGDILFRDIIAKELINSKNDVAIAISDLDNENGGKYKNKFKELLYQDNNTLSKIGNNVDKEFSKKEFIGVAFFSSRAIVG